MVFDTPVPTENFALLLHPETANLLFLQLLVAAILFATYLAVLFLDNLAVVFIEVLTVLLIALY